MEAMLKIFKGLSSGKFKLAASFQSRRREYLRVVQAMSFDFNSHFLDIGSGLGKSVLHLVMASGCKGTGIEISVHRFNKANEFLERLVEYKSVPAWVADRTKYLNGNAASSPRSPIVLSNGEHPSHVFTFSRVFAE